MGGDDRADNLLSALRARARPLCI